MAINKAQEGESSQYGSISCANKAHNHSLVHGRIAIWIGSFADGRRISSSLMAILSIPKRPRTRRIEFQIPFPSHSHFAPRPSWDLIDFRLAASVLKKISQQPH